MQGKETYINEAYGICGTITPTDKGFVVCLIDIDAEDGIVATRKFKNLNAARLFCVSFVDGVKNA